MNDKIKRIRLTASSDVIATNVITDESRNIATDRIGYFELVPQS